MCLISGTLSIIVFELIGAIGLPVFANFHGGYDVFLGPTGGYLIGFIIMAFLIGTKKESAVTMSFKSN